MAAPVAPPCRFCGRPLEHVMADLGMSPLCESYLPADALGRMEPFYPLTVRVCEACWLAQLEAFVPAEEIFTEYAYFSSYSDSWVDHARRYADEMTERLGLGPQSLVAEAASNDGYLLQHFAARGVPVLGIEPAANVARAAEERGVRTRVEFLTAQSGAAIAAEEGHADLIAANNVLAQVPDLNDFVAGLAALLAPGGLLTVEVPHIVRLVEENQFDTIYHEHFSYFSVLTAQRIFAAHGLLLTDVDELATHGGSVRLHVRHADAGVPPAPDVEAVIEAERRAGVEDPGWYRAFGQRAEETKHALVEFLIGARREGRTVAGYGAPGKSATLLNFCGVRTDLLEYTVDRNPYKQGRFLPGTHIPIHHPDRIRETRPDYLLVLPWNLREEILEQMSYIREWSGRFVLPIPRLEVI